MITHISYEDGLEGLEIGNNIFGNLIGCFSFSNEIAVTRLVSPDCPESLNRVIGDDAISITAIYPVPAISEVSVVIESREEYSTTIQVFDLSGKSLIQDRRQIVEGTNTIELNVSELSDGMFYIGVPNSKGKFITKRFVKMQE